MRLKPIPDPWQPSGPPGAQFFQEYPALVLSSVCSVQKRMLVTSYLIWSSIKPGPATKQQVDDQVSEKWSQRLNLTFRIGDWVRM